VLDIAVRPTVHSVIYFAFCQLLSSLHIIKLPRILQFQRDKNISFVQNNVLFSACHKSALNVATNCDFESKIYSATKIHVR